ncbi:Anaphase-promoting complex, subunit 10/DOC domain protein [Drechmeria coniospora]|uniref:Anaphase-promoting complex, subunit 10/DOC domain protein n=1 Tax=Drechmeria coniospora TaxID=98403 RepID=A0A151GE28_DRECN|nr:Anaphase-promoting complex, subunit 10/DOC domain protein [Drechmeria coniospora]KYK55333.1 Anaphase-promoting complex, subunit 10/DOC domain protein [Drechmeria coniospora]
MLSTPRPPCPAPPSSPPFPIYEDDLDEREPARRYPLRELSVTPFGAVASFREPSFRPVPSADKENLAALREALEIREKVLARRDVDIDQVIRQLHFHQGRLEQSLQHAMPLDSDDSSSEPDLSVLGMARAAVVGLDHTMGAVAYDDEDEDVLSQEQYDDTSIDDEQAEDHDGSLPFDPAAVGLKEISNLGKFTVGSHKPGCGVNELRSDDLKQYWQSDGPQPHKLTVYFVKRVGIRDIRFYVDYNEDESYTPTKIVFKSGTSENNLIEFAAMNLDNPVGWQQVPIAGAGGEPDGNTLVSYVLQMQVLENHQNGKDTHLRGIKIYAFDADAAQGAGRGAPAMMDAMDTTGIDDQHVVASNSHDPLGDMARSLAAARIESGETTFTMPDFMREPEIR